MVLRCLVQLGMDTLQENVLREHLAALLCNADLNVVSLKSVRAQREQRLGREPGSLDMHKSMLKGLVDQEVV